MSRFTISRYTLQPSTLIAVVLSLCASPSLAATVVATERYQMERSFGCTPELTSCTAYFPAPGDNHRLNLTRISCWITGSVTVQLATVQLWSAKGSRLLSEFLPIVAPAVNGSQVLNEAIEMQVGSKQNVVLEVQAGSGKFSGADCTLTGTMETLG